MTRNRLVYQEKHKESRSVNQMIFLFFLAVNVL